MAPPRYAPEDPTLPKPWKALIEDETGYLYFWNPETNVAQYERPAAPVRPSSASRFCILEFDGASRGNPGPAGAGAVLRVENGNLIGQVRQGLGFATNNAAEYRALILGLDYALQKGFRSIRVYGDSNLVCMQVQGLWNIENQHMAQLCEEARELKNKFRSFQISHFPRELNSEANFQANLAATLRDGEVVLEESNC